MKKNTTKSNRIKNKPVNKPRNRRNNPQIAKVRSDIKNELKRISDESGLNMSELIREEFRKLLIEKGLPTI